MKELLKQGVKGLQAFAFCVVAVNGKDTERQKKGSGLNIKTTYASNSVSSSDLKVTGIFVILPVRLVLKATLQKQSSKQSLSLREKCPNTE